MIRHSASESVPGLLEDRLGNAELADVVQERDLATSITSSSSSPSSSATAVARPTTASE
jgi:hypothetical protein